MTFSSARRYLLLLSPLLIFIPTISTINSKPEVKSATTHQITPPKSQEIPLASISAEAIYVVDLKSDSVLFQKNPNLRLNPASLTKIVTGLVALRYFPEDKVITAHSAEDTMGNTMNLESGDQLTATDLLNGLLISSANDAALTFAENYTGGYNSFVEKMNETATSLGLSNSHFTNVSGVENSYHYSTAADISRITQAALEEPLFAQIVATKTKTITSLTGKKYPLITTNSLLGRHGVIGVKTGWTPAAGECLVTLVNQNGHPVLITILKSNDRFGETKKIIDWTYKNFVWEEESI